MKKSYIFSGLVIATGITAGAISATRTTGADTSATQAQVQAQQSQLDNHEARITNTESNVKDLQTNTNTPPSTNTVYVPATQSSSAPTNTANHPESTPTPQQPVVVSSYEVINVTDSEDQDCKYTYSDGTIYQWHWKTVQYNQGTKFTQVNGWCDQRSMGTEKTTQ